MPAIGANTWIWTSPVTDATLPSLAARVAGWGFDLIEIALENASDLDPGRTAELLSGLGLGATVCAAMSPERSLVRDDPAVTDSTTSYLQACIDLAARLASAPSAGVVGGPIYAPVGETWRTTEQERRQLIDRLVGNLRPLAAYAGERGVRLAIEPLNRFETSLLNTIEQVLEVVERVANPACGVLADTFHMNIEEKSVSQAVKAAGAHLVHVQACGNDRGTPGDDHLDWGTFANALTGAHYRGVICIESFTPDNQSIARAASIWRPLAVSQDAIAVDGLAFLRRLFATH